MGKKKVLVYPKYRNVALVLDGVIYGQVTTANGERGEAMGLQSEKLGIAGKIVINGQFQFSNRESKLNFNCSHRNVQQFCHLFVT